MSGLQMINPSNCRHKSNFTQSNRTCREEISKIERGWKILPCSRVAKGKRTDRNIEWRAENNLQVNELSFAISRFILLVKYSIRYIQMFNRRIISFPCPVWWMTFCPLSLLQVDENPRKVKLGQFKKFAPASIELLSNFLIFAIQCYLYLIVSGFK